MSALPTVTDFNLSLVCSAKDSVYKTVYYASFGILIAVLQV